MARGSPFFDDRSEAGRKLALRLQSTPQDPTTIVIGLVRGGVPVAYEVAKALHLPLLAMVVRKIGAPGQPELALGALAPGNTYVLNETVAQGLHLGPSEIAKALRRARAELRRHEQIYRQAQPALSLRSRPVLLVDDGLATGSTMQAAVRAVRRNQAARVIIAVPVAPPDVCSELGKRADELVCLEKPDPFWAVGAWYWNFAPVSDEEACQLLRQAREAPGGMAAVR